MTILRLVGQYLRAAAAYLWSLRAETMAVMALGAGWGLLWWGVADVLAAVVSRRGVLAIGAGVFFLSCFGWRLLRTIATVGLYALSRKDDA